MCRSETLLSRFVEDMDQDEISKAMEMPAGLQNLGNTCYMNATIQVSHLTSQYVLECNFPSINLCKLSFLFSLNKVNNFSAWKLFRSCGKLSPGFKVDWRALSSFLSPQNTNQHQLQAPCHLAEALTPSHWRPPWGTSTPPWTRDPLFHPSSCFRYPLFTHHADSRRKI